MDQEMREFLEERFRETSQKIEGLGVELRAEMAQGASELRAEMAQGASELRKELREEMAQGASELRKELRAEMAQGLGGLRVEMARGLDELRWEMREGDRQTRVLLEGIRSDLQLTAEGLFGMSERMTNHEAEIQKSLNELKGLFLPPYQNLDSRVRVLEERAEWQRRGVLEVLREKYGKRQSS